VSSSGNHANTAPGLEPGKRYRCAACGNLTRFNIESVERVRRFWHADLTGAGVAEEVERLEARVESVACRWCGSTTGIEVVDAPRVTGEAASSDRDGA
jgi:hypothetical protein